MRSLLHYDLDAMMTIDACGIITDANFEMEKLIGHCRGELIGRPFKGCFTSPQLAEQAIRLVLRNGRVENYELTAWSRRGCETVMSWNACVLRGADGAPEAVLAAARDITDQKRLEVQLRQSEQYLRGLIEASLDGLLTVDPSLVITDVNDTMCRMAGLPRNRIIGSLLPYYFAERELAAESVRLAFQEGAVANYVLTLIAGGGSTIPVLFNAAVFRDTSGRVRGVFASARDITERKRFEDALHEKNAELEKANLAKDHFLAAMSHELRTPLNAIIGFTGTLLLKLPGPLTPDQEKQLRTVQSSARHLLSLINDLLDLARIESGKVQLSFEAVSCTAVIREVASVLEPLAKAKGLELELELPSSEVLVETDRRALSQILINLTSNAIKFTQRGVVTVAFRQGGNEGCRRTQIDVSDTGIGIRAEDQARLFQAFTRLHAGRGADAPEGTGLGLHLSEKLAQLIGGRVTFESEYGKGSRFSLVLGSQGE